MQIAGQTILLSLLGLLSAGDLTAEDEQNRLTTLPQTLQELQAASDYRQWPSVGVFSRTLKHHRLLRINDSSNVVVSETGTASGHIDVVEIILLPQEPGDEAKFGLYDATTGKRLERYPEHIKFDIEGVPAGSRETVPNVCIACHLESKPLNAVIPWTRSLQEEIEVARGNGLGIRQGLVDPIPNDDDTMQRIDRFNDAMKKRFPHQFTDLRVWIQPYLKSTSGR